jgi:hypothetical protein
MYFQHCSIQFQEKSNPTPDPSSAGFQQFVQKKLTDIEESIQRNELVMESIRSNSIQKLETILSNVLQIQSTISAFDQKFLQSITNENAELISRLEAKLANVESLHGESEKILTLQQNTIDEITSMRQQAVNEPGGKGAESCQLSASSVNQKLDELRYTVQQISENDTIRSHEQTGKEFFPQTPCEDG